MTERSIANELLSELDTEMAATRRLLVLVPEDRARWKPHPKSFAMGELAQHLANLPTWVVRAVTQSGFDFQPPGAPPLRMPPFGSMEAVLAHFDASVAAARAALSNADDATLRGSWSLARGGQVLFTRPRTAIVRDFVLNHTIHHRGQLTVYLRLCDVALPQVYGPTADAPF